MKALLLAVFLSLAALVGSVGGHQYVADLVAVDMTGATESIHRVGMLAPSSGRLVSLVWTTTAPGTGEGSAVYEVVRGEDVLCSVSIPCATDEAGHATAACTGAIGAAEHFDVQAGADSGCSALPAGWLVLGLRWK